MADFYRTQEPLARNEATIVDLSRHLNKLLAYEDISSDLSDDEESRLVDWVRAAVDLSHQHISRRYDSWLEADRAHDVYVPPDATRFREKVVISDTRAIADTVMTYQMAALAGRNPMFQLEGLNRSSRKPAAVLERLLHQHMRRTAGEAHVAQMILDSIRYGFAPTKVVWNATTNTNTIVNFDPRRAFPDPRVSWGDWHNLQFISFADYVSTNALVSSGLYPKLHKFPALQRGPHRSSYGWSAHQHLKDEGKGYNINPQSPNQTTGTLSNHFALDRARMVDELWVRLSGYEIGAPSLGLVYLVLTVLDEDVVIRLQLNPYGQQFPVAIGGIFHDRHKTYSQSLYDLMRPLHDIATWLLRSRVDNVQAALNNLIFVDPSAVSVADLIDRNPWGIVRTLPGTKPGEGVHVSQIPDVTSSHWSDISALSDLKQRVTAASDAQQGVPTSDGIRSATEIQRLTQLGSQRLGVIARIFSATTMRPLVRMMVSNIQDALDYEGSIRLPADNTPAILSAAEQEGYFDFDIQDLQGEVDYLVVDGSLPIEPARNAETWLTMLQVLNQTGLQMEYDAGKIVEEAIRAIGVPNVEDFKLNKQQQAAGPTPAQQLALAEKLRGANVQPADQVEAARQKGNVISMREAAGQGR